MPAPSVSNMADSPRSPRRGRPTLERVNARKSIFYRPPVTREIDTVLRDSISEEDLMLHGAENVDEVNQLLTMLGEWSISPEDWNSRNPRLVSPRASSPPLSPAFASPDSASRFQFSPEISPASPPLHWDSLSGRYRASDLQGETLVPSTSYHPASPPTNRTRQRSGDLNPSWMTEGHRSPQGRVAEVDQPSFLESPRTPRSKVQWISERLPGHGDTAPVSEHMEDTYLSSRPSRLQPAASAPAHGLKSISPDRRPSAAREITLSPPREFSFYSRAKSAPRELTEELVSLGNKGLQVQNDERPQDLSTKVSVGEPSLVKLAITDAISGGQNSSLHVPTEDATPMPAPITINTGSSDHSGNESLTTDDGDSSSAGLEDEVLLSPSPALGTLPWRSWKKLQRLGAGSFGTVYGGVSNDGMYFAVKEVPLDSESEQSVTQLEQEIAMLSHFQHDNIVQYLGTERTEDTLYIFLEHVTMGSLASLYNKHELFAEQIQNYTRQILHGLKYLHDQEIVHRDIKCANILVATNGTAKLADFGMAKQISKFEEVKSTKGSAQWMAPEVIDPRKRYHLPADIWSLGCTVLEMAIRGPPFGQLEWGRVFWKVAHGEAPTVPDDLDADMKDFIKLCLEVNPCNRPTASQLLQHPFVISYQSPNLSFRAPMGSSLQVITEENSAGAMSD